MDTTELKKTAEALMEKERYGFEDLRTVVMLLRSEGGCPWDREQTHESIRKDLIEETYEVIEAIDTADPELMQEELGDVLLQVVFHARIEEEEGRFCMDEVCDGICRKLIHRHPHVFGTVQADTSEQVLANWEKIKSAEKERVTVSDKLHAIPPMLPALMRAEKVGKKAKCFDFANADEVFCKVDEERSEVKEAVAAGEQEKIHEELGDLLLTVASLCRKLNVEPERALQDATNKFIGRFDELEAAVLREGKEMDTMSMAELDAIWDKMKAERALKGNESNE
jgi:tetrapyrrole methylase family protein/MazG family protein